MKKFEKSIKDTFWAVRWCRIGKIRIGKIQWHFVEKKLHFTYQGGCYGYKTHKNYFGKKFYLLRKRGKTSSLFLFPASFPQAHPNLKIKAFKKPQRRKRLWNFNKQSNKAWSRRRSVSAGNLSSFTIDRNTQQQKELSTCTTRHSMAGIPCAFFFFFFL